MNKRIKELAQQAGLARRRFMFGKYYEDDMTDEQKKFAELIIQECVNCATWVGETNKNPVEPVHTARAINKRIKQRFGVEE